MASINLSSEAQERQLTQALEGWRRRHGLGRLCRVRIADEHRLPSARAP